MHKIVFLDVDGTLINAEGMISPSAKDAIKKAKENGHQLVVCTGRSRYQLPEELLEMGFAGVISGDGAEVEVNGEVIYQASMDESHRRLAEEYLQTANAIYMATTSNAIVISEANKQRLQKYIEKKGWTEDYVKQIFGTYCVMDQLWRNDKEQKFVYFESDTSMEEMKEKLGPYFVVVPGSIIGADEKSGEIKMNGVSKASAMEIYLKYVGVDREKSIAIGDGPNDIQMLQYAHIGVAMGNAKEEVKQKADFITNHINEDGIRKAFQKLGLLEEGEEKYV